MTCKYISSFTVPFLLEENRAGRGEFDDGSYDDEYPWEYQAQEYCADENIERALDACVECGVQWRLLEGDCRQFVSVLQFERSLYITSYIGNTSEFDSLNRAEPDKRVDVFFPVIWQCTEQFLHLVARKLVD